MRKPVAIVSLLLLSCEVCTTVVFAQISEGSLAGTVCDPQNERVAGATVDIQAVGLAFGRQAATDRFGGFRFVSLLPGVYRVRIEKSGFAAFEHLVRVSVASETTLNASLSLATVEQAVSVTGETVSIAQESIQNTSSVIGATVGRKDLERIPLADRSFANIGYLAPMTAPVEPSDPTKARITAISFGGSSGLNVDLSVDGGDDNDDYTGGFLQNYSPDAMQEFSVPAITGLPEKISATGLSSSVSHTCPGRSEQARWRRSKARAPSLLPTGQWIPTVTEL